MRTIYIDGFAHDAYRDVDEADQYLSAALHGAAWTTASDDDKGKALVTMTRILDRQRWLAEYDTQAEREDLEAVQHACIEGALALLDGGDFQTERNTSQKLQSIRAGSVALTYFRGAEGKPQRFPTIVQELLRDYLLGTDPEFGITSAGTGGVSSTTDDFGHTGGV